MSYLALARKWRPKTFPEVVGQEHVVSALTNALNNQKIHHAFLFTGTRGVGKTTLARIFAKAMNCETGVSAEPCGECTACIGVDQGNFVDLIEVDAASRTKVEDTRDLLDNVQYTPTQGRYKVYLIDEVHMLSAHSFNALLKTLEEPPEHVKFLLATTNPQKLPATILSRCIQFNLKSLDIGRLSDQLQKILDAEKIKYETPALIVLARSANGSVRDALSLLDQAIAYSNGDISSEQVRSMLGMVDGQYITQLLRQVINKDSAEVLETIARMAERSVDYLAALDELITLIHNVSLYQVSPQSLEWKGIDTQELGDLGESIDTESLQLFYQISIMGKRDFEYAPDPRSGFEMVLIRMLAFRPSEKTNPDSRPKAKSIPESPSGSVTPISKPRKPEKPKLETPGSDPESREVEPATQISSLESGSQAGKNNGSLANTDLQKVLGAKEWSEFINQSGIGGISKEILMNMVPKSVDGKVIHLALDSGSRHLFSDARLKKIELHFTEVLSLDIRLNVEVDDLSTQGAGVETPAQKIIREEKEKSAAARQAFTLDSNVQELVDKFDAEIVSDSIKPG